MSGADEGTAPVAEEWAWLEEHPVFTTGGEKGGNVPRVPVAAVLEPLRFGFGLLVVAFAVSVGCTIAGVGFVVAGLSEGLGVLSWWWLALGIPAAGLALFCFSGVYVRGMELTMRERARNLVLLAGLLGGIAIGLAALGIWWASRFFGLSAAVTATACLITALIAARWVRCARLDVARILRLRATGTRYRGVVAALPDPATWNQGGNVPIRYQHQTGERVVSVRVNTYAHKIPVPGTPVIVFADHRGDLLVELDPAHPVEYHPDNRPYESDSSGGGS
ncbi:hypothetical protein [Mycolicibacter sinensis]|uniref:Uncharacterized protein n=1 Tax=Mycolicibacter sinensis (strain JDM601) TaxID=875328 RepID=A0A1A2NIG4_MYCSD|nr:hypothetical protein [Mycolicibacter sinensis]OBH14864.1 hypothetical protein A5694_11155 [Mycolicibacter sinensis]OBI31603.1 hypothetical protein A5710_17800 [Mycolicibacter sinensis]